jgi:hypothetical protein
MYTKKVSAGGSTFGALGSVNSAPGTGVNFMDGQARGPWTNGSTAVADVWQKGFVTNDKVIKPAANNDKSYQDSKWIQDKEELAFSGKGPPQINTGYHGNPRYTILDDVKNKSLVLHNYTPIKNKGFADIDTWGKTRVAAGPTSTSVNGIHG